MPDATLVPSKTAILVIDMLNEYLDPKGKVYCEKCHQIVPQINRLIEFCEAKNVLIIFNNTELSASQQPMVQKWGMHAEKGSWGARVFPELRRPKDAVIVPKTGYDGFFQTALNETLTAHGIERLAICGIHTHVCVLITATAAFERGYVVDVLSDCVTTGYQPNHDTRIRFFNTHVGRTISSEDWISEF